MQSLTPDSPAGTISASIVAASLVFAVMFLAYLDPTSRPLIAGVLTSALGVVVGFFFSQRSQATAQHATLNGMASMSAAIAAGTPGPTGPRGETGPPVESVKP